ncbi:MAG: tripartite tricarboxylate transporter TctB family protein [Anaerolineae bacterium]|nr:tripartite tricarboxylate transporter TctB family protein [Anaerolineae bacterium]
MKHDLIVAVIMLIFGAAYLAGAFAINEPSTSYSAVGPRFFPILIGIGMMLSGVWLGVQTWRKQRAGATFADLEEMDWRTWGAAALVLLVYIYALAPLGYIIATSAFLFLEARVFGSKAWLRDAIVSVGISLLVYGFFNGLLKIGLPAGVLEILWTR